MAGTEGDGVITIGLAVLIGIVAAMNLRRPIGAGPGIAVLIAAAVAAVVCVIDMSNVNDKVQEAENLSELVKADIGIGLWLCTASAVVALVSGLIMIGQRAPRDTQSKTPAQGWDIGETSNEL